MAAAFLPRYPLRGHAPGGTSHDHDDGRRGTHASRPRYGDGPAHAAILAAGAEVVGARARWRPAASHAARREAHSLPRQRGPGGRDGPALPAPLPLAAALPKRGWRAALPPS